MDERSRLSRSGSLAATGRFPKCETTASACGTRDPAQGHSVPWQDRHEKQDEVDMATEMHSDRGKHAPTGGACGGTSRTVHERMKAPVGTPIESDLPAEAPAEQGAQAPSEDPTGSTEALLLTTIAQLLQMPRWIEQLAREVKCIRITQEGVSEDIRDLREQLGVIAQRVDCIEEASRQNTTLLRSHFRERVMHPLATGLAAVIDMIEDTVRHRSVREDIGQALKQQIMSLLNDYGVTSIPVALGDTFDARLCRPVSFRPGSDQEAEGSIADVVRSGYLDEGGAVIRPAQVVVVRGRKNGSKQEE